MRIRARAIRRTSSTACTRRCSRAPASPSLRRSSPSCSSSPLAAANSSAQRKASPPSVDEELRDAEGPRVLDEVDHLLVLERAEPDADPVEAEIGLLRQLVLGRLGLDGG